MNSAPQPAPSPKANNCIRKPEVYLKGIWPDQLFKGLLPRNITPTNIDALYEINGHHLVFERKPHGYVLQAMPWGQIGAISSLGSQPATLFVQVAMHGPEGGDLPTSMLIHRLHKAAIPTTLEALQALIQAWGEHADSCRRGASCLELSWLPDAVRCAAAAAMPF